MSKDVIRVGLVGYGLAGSVFHAPLIRACRRMMLAAVRTTRDVSHAVETVDELIERSELVVIASPNATHFAIAKQALLCNRDVVIDKPMAVTLEEADELIRIARAKQRVLSVFHNRRWDSDFLTVRDVLPRLGEISLFETSWDRFRPEIKRGWREQPEPGGGLFNDLGPHLIDQVLQLFGAPDSVQADIFAQRRAAKVDDYFDVGLQYGRARVCLRSSTLVAAPRPRFAIHGALGSFVKFGLDPQELQLKSGIDPKDANFGHDRNDGVLTHADGRTEVIPTARGAYRDYYDGIAAAILDGGPVPVAADEARDGLALIELARSAANEGRRLSLSDASSRAR